MKKIKIISIIFTSNYLLNACSFTSQSSLDSPQNIKQKETIVESLPDGKYRYCSEAPSDYNPSKNQDDPDSYRWCFNFNKLENNIIGEYIYWAPWDTPHICIEGKVEGNQISGMGYQQTYGSPEPFTEEELMRNRKDLSTSELFIWDDYESLHGGNNLKVASPRVHSLGGSSGSYFAWISYDVAQLNLNQLEQRKFTPFTSSQNKLSLQCVTQENNK